MSRRSPISLDRATTTETLEASGILLYAGALLLLCPALIVGIALAADAARQPSAAAMAEYANRFLASLGPEQRSSASFSLQDRERFDWGYTPRRRRGIPFKQLTSEQRRLAKELVRSGLSEIGYRKATDIVRLESVLRELEGASRDPDLYFVSIFGTPSARGSWGWRLEGHHLSLNFTVVEGAVASPTPLFYGANPATVRTGALTGLRALAGEEDRARELLASLDGKQRERAIFQRSAPSEIVTGDAEKVDPLAPAGVPARDLTTPQRELLRKLVEEYICRMPEDVASERRERLERAGWEKIFFAWAGGSQSGQPHYYRLQGPTFLIEYDNTQNQANHIHTVWRDFEGDFGRDLLREHYRSTPHRR
jgi:hypothetical protein